MDSSNPSPEPAVDPALAEFARLARLTPAMAAELRRLITTGHFSPARRRWREYVDERMTVVSEQTRALALWDAVSDTAWERSPRLKR